MESVQISRNLTSGKYFALIMGVVALFVLSRSFDDRDVVIVCVVFVAIAGFLFYLSSKAKTVSFDAGHMYITSKDVTETVPLTDITAIKFTMTQINDEHLWKIKYLNNECKQSAVRILPRRDSFEAFKKAVQEKNALVEIKNWSHSFDFDQ